MVGFDGGGTDMPKNIVVFSDGTGQDGGVRPEQVLSNIYKLYRVCRVGPTSSIDPALQVTFYDPGLGTDTTATGWSRITRTVQKLLASVTGRGITVNIADCYTFIINHHQPGDRIYLFGFSRGAYTVRSVANLLMLCGVPTALDGRPIPRFRKAVREIAEEAVYTVLEHGAGHKRETYEAERLELARRFCTRYGSLYPEITEGHRSNVAPYFIGVFDTVAALGVKGNLWLAYQAILYSLTAVAGALAGWAVAGVVGLAFGAWGLIPGAGFGALLGAAAMFYRQRNSIRKVITDFPNAGDKKVHYAQWKGDYFDRLLSRHVPYARSANAIDESRKDFKRLPWGQSQEKVPDEIDGVERLKQVWFPGNHSDVGGSYPEAESRLSDITLQWMIEESLSLPCPLQIGPVYVHGQKVDGTAMIGDALYLHPSVAGVQHCEVVGMEETVSARTPYGFGWLTRNLGFATEVRVVQEKASLHKSVFDRLALPEVQQSSSCGPYRPVQLRLHERCVAFYEHQPTEMDHPRREGKPTLRARAFSFRCSA